MPGSQLKRLKASLREQGVIGPQQSKKQRKRNAEEARANGDKRLDKRTKLEGIREQFNPFDLKHNVRGPKFQVTTNRPATGNAAKGIQGRPSEAKTAGEELRRGTLLVEMHRRHKVGGMTDRRFGEDRADLTPEDKMLERFAMEKQRSHRAMFDLEDDEGSALGLTHMGKSLSLDGPSLVDDYEEDGLDPSDGDEDDEGRKAYQKRKQLTDGEFPDGDMAEDGQPERKKSKQEVMKEVIAKSKFHKYERQQAKEDDDELRRELDEALPTSLINELLFRKGADPKTALMEDVEKEKFDREYDLRVKQLARDARAQPSNRTLTEEERALQELSRLKELELKRQRRMEGQSENDSEESESESVGPEETSGPIQFLETEDVDTFGLGAGVKIRPTATELGFEDEDSFLIEADLVADGAELSPTESESDESESDEEIDAEEDDDEDEFTKDLLSELEVRNPVFNTNLDTTGDATSKEDDLGIPYTFDCPPNHNELLKITQKVPVEHLPVMIQRIRALYHPKLDSSNKIRLGEFSRVLVQHLSYLSSLPDLPPFATLESLIRHIHSLAKSYPVEIAEEFRAHIEDFGKTRPLDPKLPDLVILTAIGTVFPTSDHFHQVVTPSMLLMGRYLGQKIQGCLADYAKGAYMSILALQFQQASKRYVPEVMNSTLNSLAALAPVKAKESLGFFPLHEPPSRTRIHGAQGVTVRKLTCVDCLESAFSENGSDVKIAIVDTTTKVLDAAATTWIGKSAFFETFQPVSKVLGHLSTKSCSSQFPPALNSQITKTKLKIDRVLKLARTERRPLELHHHRPLAIKSNIPKFEDSFDPNKHYDPDRERAELAKLKKEHRRERKGALRELRKDANFTAREKLRVKKAKDAAYDKKYKRLVAEIQGEEGREANSYDREKAQRKRAAKRG
ncbi:nucleolar protein 14 [Xylariales sp. AK1849]|nr:nucleolar protein 14 [Xylariales sp. AK1849]